ncbi:MAG: hypothetical protein SGJ09_17180 [Phycisphaerae bacterium]|nr:hypothetical protein [Phycisphaerae bacterium]
MNRIDLVAVGSLYAVDRDGATDAGGIAADAVRAAKARGASATPVGRVGMDRSGRDIADRLLSDGFDVASVQVDSDLATPRRIQRGATIRLEPYAAFDNLQFDSDVEALARSAEAIVTDACSRRHGQGRSAIDRMLIAAPNAVRVVDFVRRSPLVSGEDRLDRETFGNASELCQVFVVDHIALRTLMPAAADDLDGARRLASQTRAIAVVLLSDASATIVASNASSGGSTAIDGPISGPISGWNRSESCEASVAMALAIVGGRPVREALSMR